MRLDDKVAIITGSTSGIGRATASLFLQRGANVMFTGRTENASSAVADLLALPQSLDGRGEAGFVAADVSQAIEVQQVVKQTVERWGRIDCLVNNAAMMTFQSVVDLSEDDWDKVLAVNLKGPFLFSKYSVPHMAKGAAIVNVSSVHAVATTPAVVPYAASKGGLEALTRGLAIELRDREIRVNAVRLGAVDTPMLRENPNVKSGKEIIAEADMGAPREVAEAIGFLCSAGASFITGSVVSVDGGRLARLG